MACPLEQALAVMVTTFHKYSGKDGDKATHAFYILPCKKQGWMGKPLAQPHTPKPTVVSPPLQKQMDEAEFRRLMNDLDHNKDSEVDFKEYVCFLACITMGFNEFFKDGPNKQPRKK
ncbi:Protein S100-A4 [Eurypyga helias]|uniref:Protein S100-A4 n=1 Tax=Eurypyga helias TaxID=54383 RepID=A0A093IH58_EURHL|nr:Protein S100-A4 [Eurypyga helias]